MLINTDPEEGSKSQVARLETNSSQGYGPRSLIRSKYSFLSTSLSLPRFRAIKTLKFIPQNPPSPPFAATKLIRPQAFLGAPYRRLLPLLSAPLAPLDLFQVPRAPLAPPAAIPQRQSRFPTSRVLSRLSCRCHGFSLVPPGAALHISDLFRSLLRRRPSSGTSLYPCCVCCPPRTPFELLCSERRRPCPGHISLL